MIDDTICMGELLNTKIVRPKEQPKGKKGLHKKENDDKNHTILMLKILPLKTWLGE